MKADDELRLIVGAEEGVGNESGGLVLGCAYEFAGFFEFP